MISMNYNSSTSSWKPWGWVRLNLTLTMRDIYINSNVIPLKKFTSSRGSTDFKDIFQWSSSKMITKALPISTRIVLIYAVKLGITFWVWWKVNINWENRWSGFSNRRKAIVEQILAIEERNKSQRAGLWESQSVIKVGKLTIWVRSFEIAKL